VLFFLFSILYIFLFSFLYIYTYIYECLGPLDAGSSAALPKQSLPSDIIIALQQQVAHVGFASNPSKIRCYTQEIVLFREDLLQKLQKNLIFPSHDHNNTTDYDYPYDSSSLYDHSAQPIQSPNNHEKTSTSTSDSQPQQLSSSSSSSSSPEITQQMIETLLDQAHLLPLPMHSQPIYWELDHIFRLFPLPHVLIIADPSCDSYCYTYKDCICINPGMFMQDFSFVVYQLSSKNVQFSRVPETS
jgi:DNA polymerase epsilon subunit 2